MTEIPIPAEPGPRPVATRPQPLARLAQMKKELTMLAVMIALAVITAVLNPVFLGADNLRNTVRHISLISLFALGEAVVIIAGGIDLSVGSIICISAVTTSYLTMYAGLRHRRGGRRRHRRCRWSSASRRAWSITWLGVQPFVVTLGSMLLLRGVAEVLTGGTDIGFQGKFPGFRFLGEGIGLGMPMPFWFALGGHRDHRVPDAPDAVRALLLRDRLERRGGAPVGRAGAADPARHVRRQRRPVGRGRHPLRRLPAERDARRSGSAYELHAVAAAVLGGCSLLGGRGSVFGVLIGAGIMQITFNAVNLVGKSLWQNVVAGGVILAAVIVDRVFEKNASTRRAR